jgi:DNA-binding CsgD family transcriptional regulator
MTIGDLAEVRALSAGSTTRRGSRVGPAGGPRWEQAARLRAVLAAEGSALVVGDAGVGKTHLVTAVLAELRAAGPVAPRVVTIAGSVAHGGLPLAPLEPLLGDAGLLAISSFPQTVQALCDTFALLAAGAPLVVRIEDAHLLDHASSQALGWLVRQGQVVVVATARAAGLADSDWGELWRGGFLERVDIAPFTLDETGAWLHDELAGPVAPQTVRRIWTDTGGNPLDIADLVQVQRRAGALVDVGGVWTWTGRAFPGPHLLDVVGRDVAHLSPEGRSALEVTAIAYPISLAALLDVVPQSAVDELVRAGVVTLVPRASAGGRGEVVVDFVRGLYAEAVRAGVPRSRRRAVLESLGSLPIGNDEGGLAQVRLVALALDSGVLVAPARVRTALQAALVMRHDETAMEIATGALDQALPRGPWWAELLVRRAFTAWCQGQWAQAERDLVEVLDHLAAAGPLDEAGAEILVEATRALAVVLLYADRTIERMDREVARMREWLVRDGAAPRAVAAVELCRRAWRLYAGRFEDLGEAVAALDEVCTPADALPLAGAVIAALSQAGRFAEAARLGRRYVPLALADQRVFGGSGEVLRASLAAALWSGDIAAVEHLAADLPGDQALVPVDFAVHRLLSGFLALARGSWSQARADLRGVNATAEPAISGLPALTYAGEALACAIGGDGERARALLDASLRQPEIAFAVVGPEAALMRVDTLAWLRDPRVAAAATSLAADARARALPRIEMEALHRLLERQRGHGLDAAAVARVAQLAPLVDGPRAAAIAARVAALAVGDDDLARIAERDLNRCGVWLPPSEPPVALTRREQEISALAVAGMTSRAIAQRFTLSVRTVDSHLARVFAKTGTHSREELAAILR